MKKIITIMAIGVGAFLTSIASAQILYSNEFWISTNATGNMYPSGGTLASPLDGSTATNFDSNMRSLPPNSTIHILAGTYQTYGQAYGQYGWYVKSGQKICGSGMDVTVLQLNFNPNDSLSNYVYTVTSMPGSPVTNAEVCDLTCNCNFGTGTNTPCGVDLDGTFNAVRRVKVINAEFHNGTSEGWGIVLQNFELPSSIGNVIESCEVSHFAGGTALTAIAFNGQNNGTNWISGEILNNRVLLSAPYQQGFQGINGCWDVNTLIEGNYIEGADNGIYGDTGGCSNIMISHNIFKDCYQGVCLNGIGARDNITIDFNSVSLPTGNLTTAFNFWTGTLTNVFIFGNIIKLDGPGPTSDFPIAANDITGLIFENNMVDASVASNQWTSGYFINVANLNIDNNYDLFGNYLYDLNIPTLGGVDVSSFGLSLVSSADASSALTNLGLPSNPLAIVTNNEIGVSLSGTFSGNGSGLTSLPVSGLVSESEPVSIQYFPWDQVQQPPYCGNAPVMDFLASGSSGLWPMAKISQFVGAAELGYTNITVSTVIFTTNTFTLSSFGAILGLDLETNGLNGGFSGNYQLQSPNANFSFYGTNALPVSYKFTVPYGILTNAYNGEVGVMPFGTPSNIWVGQITITNSLF